MPLLTSQRQEFRTPLDAMWGHLWVTLCPTPWHQQDPAQLVGSPGYKHESCRRWGIYYCLPCWSAEREQVARSPRDSRWKWEVALGGSAARFCADSPSARGRLPPPPSPRCLPRAQACCSLPRGRLGYTGVCARPEGLPQILTSLEGRTHVTGQGAEALPLKPEWQTFLNDRVTITAVMLPPTAWHA